MLPHVSAIKEKLNIRKTTGLSRKLTLAGNGIDFSSNDYLGYSSKADLKKNIQSALDKHGCKLGSTGSRLLTGNNVLAEEVEAELATYFNAEACLILNSGYTANLAVISCLPQKGDLILVDSLVHASIKDGYRLKPGVAHQAFQHNNLIDLERKLVAATANCWVVVESVYSMDGDRAPLEAIAKLCKKYQAALVVDEAHSTGLWGPNGAGLSIKSGIDNNCIARIYTFGKAFGYHGACVVGSRTVIEYLINFSRPFIYTTAPPPEFYLTIRQIIKYRQNSTTEFNLLLHNIALYASKLHLAGIGQLVNNSPIQILPFAGNELTRTAAKFLQDSGYDVRPILSPTVPKGSERLRICLHSFNTQEQITGLVDAVKTIIK